MMDSTSVLDKSKTFESALKRRLKVVSAGMRELGQHCEEEFTTIEQCTKGASVLLNAVLKCDREGIL